MPGKWPLLITYLFFFRLLLVLGFTRQAISVICLLGFVPWSHNVFFPSYLFPLLMYLLRLFYPTAISRQPGSLEIVEARLISSSPLRTLSAWFVSLVLLFSWPLFLGVLSFGADKLQFICGLGLFLPAALPLNGAWLLSLFFFFFSFSIYFLFFSGEVMFLVLSFGSVRA